MKQYMLYKGDTFIDVGTASEIAKRQHISIRTIHFYNSNVYKTTRCFSNSMVVYELEED